MSSQRYMIVDHPRESSDVHYSEGKMQGTVPIHHLLLTYHWHRIDETHVILKGSYGALHHNDLIAHPKVTVLPHGASNKVLRHHCCVRDKEHHFMALSNALGLSDDSKMADFLDAVEDKLGPLFQPAK